MWERSEHNGEEFFGVGSGAHPGEFLMHAQQVIEVRTVLHSNCSGWIWVVFVTQLGTI